MKKVILILCVFFCSVTLSAINPIKFKLTQDGYFVSELDNKDYVVVQFEGMSAHQIYQVLASNVGASYDLKNVNMIENSYIKVRAYSSNLYYNTVMGMSQGVPCYYQLEFKIKDGRVRVSSPYIEDTATHSMQFADNEGAFRRIVKKWFKNGEVKENRKDNVEHVEIYVNEIINRILGLSKITQEEDW